jgi:SAM-dependent methyltransferase
MGRPLNLIERIHRMTPRDYYARMTPEKPACCEVAKRFDADFWDGDRKYGYGGYRYDGRWKPLAEALARHYGLAEGAGILDVGCGKGFLLHEFRQVLPGARLSGYDVSRYAVKNGKEEVRDSLQVQRAQDPYPAADDSFDLVVSVNTLHNLYLYELEPALREIERVGRSAYIVVESYRNEAEKTHLACWNLTGECLFTPQEWAWLFERFGYGGDYDFIFFE